MSDCFRADTPNRFEEKPEKTSQTRLLKLLRDSFRQLNPSIGALDEPGLQRDVGALTASHLNQDARNSANYNWDRLLKIS